MSQTSYADRVLQVVRDRHSDKPEYIQAVEEFLPSIAAYLDEHPEIEDHNLLELIVEPERVIQFRIPWQDDAGRWQVNLGYRVQYNSALGPYKGGIRFHPTVNESIIRFLGFEQTFKNALTNLPLGGGKDGTDFDPSDKSDAEIMRFCQSFMTELAKYIDADTDVPAGDIGVRHREIGYMYGQYKRLKGSEPGVLTGKPTDQWGSFARTEATGYGLVYFTKNALEDRGDSLEGKRVAISGLGTVATYALEKAVQEGATVITMSNTTGYLVDENGIDVETVKTMLEERNRDFKTYTDKFPEARFVEGESVWAASDLTYDIALPCATQNEIDGKMARSIVDENGIQAIFEGANMPSSDEAIRTFKEAGVLYGPGKAANAGGVAVSGFEMSQNAMRLQWTFEEVDQRLKDTMADIYTTCSETAEAYADKDDLQAGANIAGFARVSQVMLAQGLV